MTNFSAAKQFVEFGLAKQAAGERESASGPGSALSSAEPTVWMFDTLSSSLSINSVLDLGCGDWNWMRHTSFATRLSEEGSGCSYEGWDAHEELIERLREEFGNERTLFDLADIVTTPFPKVDLIIARDVLFHLNTSCVDRIIRKARRSAKFLIANSFSEINKPYRPREYLGIPKWRFGLLNLEAERFGMSKFLHLSIEEKAARHPEGRRFLNLYVLR